MESPYPMDRVLIGDVGFGKTEVAMRAAFKAVMSGKQVMYLAPTTVLSRQHYYTFKDRLEEYGLEVGLLNRFVSPAQQKEYLDSFKQGTLDILIGTHRLLSKDVTFKDLGLLIVDEEQRFGVTHKEKIKELKVNVDVLTLTATPIPRTFQMAMMGIRGLSTLSTPPSNRYPIQTYLIERNNSIIKEAIQRELARRGQVFFLHNSISSIEYTVEEIKKLVPGARVAYAHGSVSRQQLEKILTDFIDKKFDVLVSTTIIETGIDIPNANTILIDDADRLGLSQLYQIRGRVGRSDKIAYCYLMTKPNKSLSDIATDRLKAIKEFTELGSGYKVAHRDLQIRGAGDILGSSQSGFIDQVGMELFTKMLDEEIRLSRGEDVKTLDDISNQFKLQVSKTIDDAYISDDKARIEIHKKIDEIHTVKDIEKLQRELIDRYGYFDEKLTAYMYEKIFENIAPQVGMIKLLRETDKITIRLNEDTSSKLGGRELFLLAYETSDNIDLKLVQGTYYIFFKLKNLKKHYSYYLSMYMLGIKELLDSK